MALETDTVDASAVGLDELDDAGRTLGLVGAVLQVVVVIEETCIRVGGLGVLEGDGDISLANSLQEDIVTVGAVLVEGCSMRVSLSAPQVNERNESREQLTLIDHIPLVTDTLVSPYHRVNVGLDDLKQCGVVETTAGDPGRQLAVPDQRVAANRLAVLLGERHHGVGAVEREIPLTWLRRLPLHGILGCDRAKLGRDDLLLLRVITDREGRADILLANGLESSVEGCWSLASILSCAGE